MSCGVCGEDGHNRRTHDQHPEPQDGALLDQIEAPVNCPNCGASLDTVIGSTDHTCRNCRAVVRADGSWAIEAPTVQGAMTLVESDCRCPGPVELPPERHLEGCRFRPTDFGNAPGQTPGPAWEPEHPPLTEYGNDLINPGQQQHAERTADVANQIASAFQVPGELLGPGVDPWPLPPWRTVLGPDEPIRITEPGVYSLTAEEYHSIEVTGDWFSNSDGKALLRTCPAQFDYDRKHGVRKTSDAFDFGHVWHAVILGKGEAYEVFEPKKLDGRTAAGKEQKAAVEACRAAGVTPVYGDHFALILAMAEAVQANPTAHALLTAPGRQEVCLFWREDIKVTDPHNALFGQVVTVQRRAMIDHLPDIPEGADTVTLVDGKTAEEVKPDDNLRKRIYDYAYHRQADGYAAGVEALFNVAADVVFLFQSKKPPHLIVPVDLDTPAMRVAAAENRQALELWAECVATGEWPGYTKGIATSGVPAWIERQYEDEMVIS